MDFQRKKNWLGLGFLSPIFFCSFSDFNLRQIFERIFYTFDWWFWFQFYSDSHLIWVRFRLVCFSDIEERNKMVQRGRFCRENFWVKCFAATCEFFFSFSYQATFFFYRFPWTEPQTLFDEGVKCNIWEIRVQSVTTLKPKGD